MAIEKEWLQLVEKLKPMLGKEPNLDAILFLIGVQELGQGFRPFSKEEKQDLMHIGTCRVLSSSGYYSLEGTDQEGWPHWKLEKKLPSFSLKEQEEMLRMHIIEYFENENLV